jgi:hypothetical protein
MRSDQPFPASSAFIAWAQGLSGMLTRLKTDYGQISDMVERPTWDEGKTDFALALLRSLRVDLAQMEEELAAHVEEKSGKKPR